MDKRWNSYSLEEVARLVSGRTPEREQKEYYASQGTPWVKIENLNQGFITHTAEYLSEKGREKVNLVPENSVLFSIVGTVGKVGIAARELATNQQIVSLIFDETKVLPLFGYYCLRYHAREICKLSNQTTMALISRKTLGQYRIMVPDRLEEQQEIVQKLQKFEEYAKKKEKIREKISRYDSVLFQKMFCDEILYHEKLTVREFLREPVFGGNKRREELGAEQPGIDSGEFEKPYLTEREGKKTGVQDSFGEKAPEADQVQEGDILLRNGKMILVRDQKTPRYIDRSILCIRTRENQLLPEVLYAYLSLPGIREKLYTHRKAGDTRKRPIRAGELGKMKLPYFTWEKQKEYETFHKKIRQIQHSLDQEILCAWKTFSGISRMLMNGYEEAEPLEEKIEASDEKKTQVNITEDAGKNGQEQIETAHLILAVLAGWCPRNERAGEYYQRRQEIFRRAQPYFQSAALSFVTRKGQQDYLLERDFLAYHSEKLSQEWDSPLELLRKILKQAEMEEITDAHLAFHGETGICTESDWEMEVVLTMAKDAWKLLAEFSGYHRCAFLL